MKMEESEGEGRTTLTVFTQVQQCALDLEEESEQGEWRLGDVWLSGAKGML